MGIYVIIMLTAIPLLLAALMVIFISQTTRFLRSREELRKGEEHREFRDAVELFDTPYRLELFILKYPKSAYCEQAQFEIAGKYFEKKQFRLAKEAYEKFIELYPNSFLKEHARQKLKTIEEL